MKNTIYKQFYILYEESCPKTHIANNFIPNSTEVQKLYEV